MTQKPILASVCAQSICIYVVSFFEGSAWEEKQCMRAKRQSEHFAVLFIIIIFWRSHRVGSQFLVARSVDARVQKIKCTSENRRPLSKVRNTARRYIAIWCVL